MDVMRDEAGKRGSDEPKPIQASPFELGDFSLSRPDTRIFRPFHLLLRPWSTGEWRDTEIDSWRLQYHITCLRGLCDDQSKAAIEAANVRLSLFDAKSSARVQVASAAPGGVIGLIKLTRPDSFKGLPLHEAAFYTALIAAFLQAFATLFVIVCNYNINNIVLYKLPNPCRAEAELKSLTDINSGVGDADKHDKLPMRSQTVIDYLKYLAYFVVARDYWFQKQRHCYLGCLVLALIAVISLMPVMFMPPP